MPKKPKAQNSLHKVASTGDLVLTTLAAFGTKGVAQSEFKKNEVSALRRLAKKQLVIRDEDKVWYLVAELEKSALVSGTIIAEGIEDTIQTLQAESSTVAPVADRIDTIRTAAAKVIMPLHPEMAKIIPISKPKPSKASMTAMIARFRGSNCPYCGGHIGAHDCGIEETICMTCVEKNVEMIDFTDAQQEKASAPKKTKAVKTPKPEGGWPISIETQVCSKGDSCVTSPGVAQPVASFYRDRSRKTGVDCWCKGCTKAHAAAKRAEKEADEAAS